MGKKKDINQGLHYFQEITLDGIVDVPEIDESEQFDELEDPRHYYKYDGAVKYFNNVVLYRFKAVTLAKSEAEAKRNLVFQAKKRLNLLPSAGGVKLTGPIQLMEKVAE